MKQGINHSYFNSMKIQEINYDSIPITEQQLESNEASRQIRRRVICARVGKATLVRNDEEVNKSQGHFRYKAQNLLKSVLKDKIIASIFFKLYLLPFCKQFSNEKCLQMIDNPASINAEFDRNAEWLA